MIRPTDLPAFPRRPADAHKGSVGSVLVIAGSVGMSGAAYLCAKAALRTGAGVVVTACPDAIQPVLATKHTCVMVRPFPSTAEGTLHLDGLERLLALSRDFDAVALGPGLSRHPLTAELARRLITELEQKLVVDADALNAIEGHATRMLPALSAVSVLTPHPGEFARIAGRTTSGIQAERRLAIEALIGRTGAAVVLKGKGTLVGQRGRPVWENGTGNPGMATAGAGDVLSGVVAALLAAGLDAYDAARLGVHLHGRAGDLAAAEVGQAPLIATDILDKVPAAIREEEAA
jgi:NAD(P)H-hydrate epimerase